MDTNSPLPYTLPYLNLVSVSPRENDVLIN
ncbi:hypothetical protein HNQ75_003971 [Rhizobium flavum]|uniref:Uncharacterized protein n=1 Tax=Pseudorhizobium flavum TaxID=1335061 RepID=A0A7X0DEH0_9HYPH|nr:hypothetical protein [Pseudorhizobium flavum]CAD6631446.1 hypothetical protein RFYW14_04509 [Pseudorhizobium flavum]